MCMRAHAHTCIHMLQCSCKGQGTTFGNQFFYHLDSGERTQSFRICFRHPFHCGAILLALLAHFVTACLVCPFPVLLGLTCLQAICWAGPESCPGGLASMLFCDLESPSCSKADGPRVVFPPASSFPSPLPGFYQFYSHLRIHYRLVIFIPGKRGTH